MQSKSTPTCEELGIPARLHQHHRETQNDFDLEEELYRRIPDDIEVESGGRIATSSIGRAFNDIHELSVNRQKFCRYPTDVLYHVTDPGHRFTYGVAVAEVQELSDIEVSFKHPQTQTEYKVLLKVVHDPHECMYPHSLIQVQQDDLVIQKQIKPKAFRAFLRTEISGRFTLSHDPDPSWRPPQD